MQIITLHDTDTEEVIGSVYPKEVIDYPKEVIDFDDFYDEIYKTFSEYHKSDEFDELYDINDFVEYHNNNSKIKIDSVVSDYIQLSE